MNLGPDGIANIDKFEEEGAAYDEEDKETEREDAAAYGDGGGNAEDAEDTEDTKDAEDAKGDSGSKPAGAASPRTSYEARIRAPCRRQ